MSQRKAHFGSQRGQTSLEYLLLLVATFLTAYIMVRGPVANFTNQMLAGIFSGIQNLVTYAELTDQPITEGQDRHPASRERLKPLHL